MSVFVKENKNRFYMLLATGAVSILFSLNFYFYTKTKSLNRDNSRNEAMIKSLKKENRELKNHIDLKSGDVKYLKDQNKALDKMIEKQRSNPKSKKTINKDKDQRV